MSDETPDLKAEAEKWLEQARSDVEAGRLLENAPKVLAAQSAFHFQQAIEKALKAVLIAAGVNFPRTHDLLLLVRLIEENTEVALPDWVDVLGSINAYAVQTRYPGVYEPITAVELADAEQTATEAVNWAAGFVQGRP